MGRGGTRVLRVGLLGAGLVLLHSLGACAQTAVPAGRTFYASFDGTLDADEAGGNAAARPRGDGERPAAPEEISRRHQLPAFTLEEPGMGCLSYLHLG